MNQTRRKAGMIATALISSTASAFVLPQSRTVFNVGTITRLNMVDQSANDEVAALRAAAAKYREESERLAKELGKDISVDSSKKAAPKPVFKQRSKEEVLAITSAIDFSAGDATSQSSTLDDLVSRGDLYFWKSAAAADSSTLRTYPVTQDFLENRSDGKITAENLGVNASDDVSLDDFKDATIVVAGGSFALAILSLAFLPGNLGASLSYLFALLPVVYLGIGSTAPGLIAGAISTVRGDFDDGSQQTDRVCRHEAGHFLCGYLCGLAVKSYAITENGFPKVEFHPASDVDNGQREFTREEIAALSVVALSGSVAEVIELGQARGGRNDLIELNNLFRRSESFMGVAKQQDMTRWGALTAYKIIKENSGKYESLVQAFKEKKTVAECVAVVEAS